MVDYENGIDYGMRDTLEDYFEEPNTNNTDVFWHSPDIFVRNQPDGRIIQVHENPEFGETTPSYVYVRVFNNGCESIMAENNKVKLYWAKANTSLSWPEHWDGTLTMPNGNGEQVVMGGQIGEVMMPPLYPGESKLIEIPWIPPNPAIYEGVTPNPWHFCLLARIDFSADPMTFPASGSLGNDIKNNNNIVMKNTTVVDLKTNSANPEPVGGVIAIGNSKTFSRK